MNDLININYEAETLTISGRELHEALEVKTAYKDWFPRMCEYGFTENIDFCSFLSESTGGRPSTDHNITIPMAKEICMLQRSEKGKQFRQYFIKVEEAWNSPEMIMGRALKIANQQIDTLKTTIAIQDQQISELKPKASYYDVILNSKDLMSITEIAKDYGKSAKWLNEKLNELKIQFKQNKIWLLYQKYAEKGYTSTKTHNYLDDKGDTHAKVHTYWTQKGRLFIYDLLKSKGILPTMERR